MNDVRVRGLAVAGSDAAGRKSPHNHAQTARSLRRSLRNAAAGARLIQAEGWTANRLPTSQARLPKLPRTPDELPGWIEQQPSLVSGDLLIPPSA
jgi:hypothetical protein